MVFAPRDKVTKDFIFSTDDYCIDMLILHYAAIEIPCS